MSDKLNEPCVNTDRELWREPPGDYYASSIHVTESGGVGINVGGHVIVMPLRGWHEAAKNHAAAEECGRRSGVEEAAKEIESAQPSGDVDQARFLVTRSLYARRVRQLILADLAQRILAALESMQNHASGAEFRSLAAELRAHVVEHADDGNAPNRVAEAALAASEERGRRSGFSEGTDAAAKFIETSPDAVHPAVRGWLARDLRALAPRDSGKENT